MIAGFAMTRLDYVNLSSLFVKPYPAPVETMTGSGNFEPGEAGYAPPDGKRGDVENQVKRQADAQDKGDTLQRPIQIWRKVL